jgi:aminoglycoside phosphotransferase (APT) family kinase protein
VPDPIGANGFAGSGDWWGWFRDFLPQARQRIRELCPADVAARLCRDLHVGAEAGADDVPPKCLLHGDSASIHWRIDGDGSAGMLDLGDACVGDPVWDLVVLTHWDEARLPAVLDGYRADDLLRARVRRRYEPYRVVRHLLAVDWLIEHGYDPAATVRELGRIVRQHTAVVATG